MSSAGLSARTSDPTRAILFPMSTAMSPARPMSRLQSAVDYAINNYGKLDVMFSNAGVTGRLDPGILTVDYSNFKRVFDVNVYGVFLAAFLAARVMNHDPGETRKHPLHEGRCFRDHGEVTHVYSSSKHAIVGLAKNLGVESVQPGIRVNCLSPFAVATPMLREAFGSTDTETVEGIVSAAANPEGAVLKAGDVAEAAALYLAGDESKYVSGMNLVVDVGSSLGITLKTYFP